MMGQMINNLGGVDQMSLLQLFNYSYFNKTATGDIGEPYLRKCVVWDWFMGFMLPAPALAWCQYPVYL